MFRLASVEKVLSLDRTDDVLYRTSTEEPSLEMPPYQFPRISSLLLLRKSDGALIAHARR
jgi:hypothetical protein